MKDEGYILALASSSPQVLINYVLSKCSIDKYFGVKAARQARMKCIGYSNPGSGNQDLADADFILHTFDRLTISLVEKLFVE